MPGGFVLCTNESYLFCSSQISSTAISAGLTPDMRFFIAYAGAWAQNIRPDEELRLTKIDEHSLGKNRVNGILVHIDAWYDAFNIASDDKMYVAPYERVKLW